MEFRGIVRLLVQDVLELGVVFMGLGFQKVLRGLYCFDGCYTVTTLFQDPVLSEAEEFEQHRKGQELG